MKRIICVKAGALLAIPLVDIHTKKLAGALSHGLDRWIFDHLGSPPEDLLEAQKKLVKRPTFHSLQEAADALKRANNLEHPDVYSDSGDDDTDRDSYSTATKTNTATEPLEEFRDVYQSQNPLYWSPQLGPQLGEGPPDILERRPPYDPDRREVATVRLKNGKTKRQYRQVAATYARMVVFVSAFCSVRDRKAIAPMIRMANRWGCLTIRAMRPGRCMKKQMPPAQVRVANYTRPSQQSRRG